MKVYNLINNLSTSKATGIDKISAKVLRAAASAIAPGLTEIFNMSIDSNRFPSDWKTARVIPLFKNGQRSVLDNYRPISILPVVSKIMERLCTTKYPTISLKSNFYPNISLVLDPYILQQQRCWTVQMNGTLIWTVAFKLSCSSRSEKGV